MRSGTALVDVFLMFQTHDLAQWMWMTEALSITSMKKSAGYARYF
jgi:hypothetical protein